MRYWFEATYNEIYRSEDLNSKYEFILLGGYWEESIFENILSVKNCYTELKLIELDKLDLLFYNIKE